MLSFIRIFLKTRGIIFILFAIVFTGQGQITSKKDQKYVPKSIIFKVAASYAHLQHAEGIADESFNELMDDIKAEKIARIFPNHTPPSGRFDDHGNPLTDLSRIWEIKYSTDISEQKVINALLNMEVIEYATLRIIHTPFYIPYDSSALQAKQYQLDLIKAWQAWDIHQGDTGIFIGIIDTGTDFLHPDLGNYTINYDDPVDGVDNDNDGYIDNYRGWDLVNNTNNAQTGTPQHGVWVTGIAAASTDNGVGVSGTAFNCRYLPVKVVNDQYIVSHGYEGIVYAADQGCQVINCSWGSKENSGQYGQDIINYATFNCDALVVVAGGNDNNEELFWPASYDNAMGVAASDWYDRKADFSTYNNLIDIIAPGKNIFGTYGLVGGTQPLYRTVNGTSFSAPVVAGVAAITRSYYPGLSALQIAERLRTTANQIDMLQQTVYDTTFLQNDTLIDTITVNNLPYQGKLGAGRVNMLNALTSPFTPAIRVRDMVIDDHNDGLFRPGDTLRISGTFYNYLDTAFNTLITLSSANPNVIVSGSTFNAGTINTLDYAANHNNPFTIRLLSSVGYNERVSLKISYFSNGMALKEEYIMVDVNPDYEHIRFNNIALTVSANSRLGYSDYAPFKRHGLGFSYKNHTNLLSCGGLIAGISMAKVSDNIYGPVQGAYDYDFTPLTYLATDSITDHQYTASGTFTDALAGTNKINIAVKQELMAWNTPGNSNYVMLRYTLTNPTASPITNLYTGLFADFDVLNSARNHTGYNTDKKLAYTFKPGFAPYVGMQMLNNLQPYHYAFDNNGNNGSININDGFISIEKYDALHTNRHQAGVFNATGNDVSDMISAGPFTMLTNDTIVLTYAIHAADNLLLLLQSADAAQAKHDGVSVQQNISRNPAMEIWPNPAKESTFVVFTGFVPESVAVSIFSLEGKEVSCQHVFITNGLGEIDLSGIKKGVYLIKTGLYDHVQKLIVY